jgi:hypothetical protein
MTLYNEIILEFRKHAAELLGISVEGCGAMPPSPVTVGCICRCSPISNPRATSTAPIAQARASASAHYLSSIDRSSPRGSIALRSLSNPGADEILDALEKLSDALAHPVVNQVRRHFGGRMRLVFRHFP